MPSRAVAVMLAAPLLAGCYSFAQPSTHPGDARDLLVAITRRGVTADAMAGESACRDPSLTNNAIHLRASVPSDPVARDVWIYQFRTRGFDDTAAVVDACQAEYAAANPDSAITRLDIPIWRAFGADWSPDLEAALRAGLTEAADMGLTGSVPAQHLPAA
jgi:hypothetical protein